MTGAAILSRPVDVAHPPRDAVEIVASEAEREKLAATNDLVAVKDLRATIALTPGPRGSVEVVGRVVADIVQTCVVSLVPVDAHIDESFSVRFVRPADAPATSQSGVELVIDPDRPDPPEILDGPSVDIGALTEEAFVLAIDPYPRAPGATLPAELAGADAAADSPFAVLAGLAKGGKRGE